MGIVQYFEVEGASFYEKIEGRLSFNNPVIGQFCWAPILNISEIPRVFDVQRNQPEEHYEVDYVVRNMTTDDFKSKNRLPLKLLKLRDQQEAIINSASKRPCVLLHYGGTAFSDIRRMLPSMGKKHLQKEKNALLLPLYGVQNKTDHEGGFPPIMVSRIRAMMYDQFFFFPKNAENSPLTNDSIARFDSLQFLINNHPVCDFLPYKLTDECLSLLFAVIRRWFYLDSDEKNDEELEAIIELCNETCPDEALPK